MGDSKQINYWIADMTIPHTRTWMETWQWPEAIRRNVYIAQYLYEENGNWAQVTSFYRVAENVKEDGINRKQNPAYSNIQHGLENWDLSWRQFINVDKWHCFNGSPFADTIEVSKYTKGSYRMTLFEVDSKFCEEKNIIME